MDTADSLQVTLSAPSHVERGQEVEFTIIVRNTALRPIDLSLGGRDIAFDIKVSRQGASYWQRLQGEVVPSILQLKTLQPGEAFRVRDVWKANVDPGIYDVDGNILTDAEPLHAKPIKLTVQ